MSKIQSLIDISKIILILLAVIMFLLICIILTKDIIATTYCNFFHGTDDYCYISVPLFHKNWCKTGTGMNEYFAYCELK